MTCVDGRVLATIALATALLACDGDEPLASQSPTTSVATTTVITVPITTSTSTSTTSTSTTSSSTTSTTSSSSSTSTTSTTFAPSMAISRPYVDPSICTGTGARELRWEGHTIDQLFSIRTELPIAMQVVADPAFGVGGGFAMLLRYPARLQEPGSWTDVVMPINGIDVELMVYANGNGAALWNLPDGSQAYLRSRDLTQDQIVAVLDALTPRPTDAPIAGFDVGPESPLPLVTEHLNSGIAGTMASFSCQSADVPPRQYRIDAIDAQPVFEYLAVLDRARPIDAGEVDGTTIVIAHGLASETSPRVEDVVNADQATWDALLAQPF